jgi:hypothetical protein
MLQTIGIIILIILFIVLISAVNSRSNETSLLTGIWTADADFCKKAEINCLIIKIDEPGWISNSRTGYILMQNDEGLIINNPVEFNLSLGISLNPKVCYCREYSVSIDWLDEDAPEFFPSDQTLYYYPSYGKLVFCTEEIHAVVYKDNATSFIADQYKTESVSDSTSE